MRQFDALVKRHIHDKEQSDYRAALVCSVVANCRMRGKGDDKVFTPDDFMPQKAAKPKKRQTPEDMLAVVKVLNAALGGRVVEN